MSKGGSAPAAPDMAKLATLQGAEDRKTLQYGLNNSRTTTVNPFGTSGWKHDQIFDEDAFNKAMAAYKPSSTITPGHYEYSGGSGGDASGGQQIWVPETQTSSGTAPNREDYTRDSWTNTQTLSPESQGIYDTATSKLGEAAGKIGTDADAYNQSVADAIYARMRRYQDPADAQARSAMQSNLADRGFQVGNEGYNTEMTRLDDSQARSRADAADQATIQGMTEGRAQNAQQLAIAQALQALRSGQVAGVSGMPTTTTTPQISSPDILGSTMQQYNDQLDSYNASQASSTGLLGSLLTGGAMLASGGALGGLGSLGGLLSGMGGGGAMPQSQFKRLMGEFY